MSKQKGTYWGSCYSFWWGQSPEEALLQQIQNSEGKQLNRPLYQINYSTNYLYQLISVASLGLVVPTDVRWWLTVAPETEYQGPIRRKKASATAP